MDPAIWSAIIGAGAGFGTSALSLLGKRGPSERDLMWEQQRTHEYGLLHNPSTQMRGLRAAGVNPMLPYASGGRPAGGITPSIAAPVDKTTDAAKLFAAGISTAVDVYRSIAEVELKREQSKLTGRQAVTEKERPGSLLAQQARDYEAAQLSSAMNAHERQKMGKTMVETAIRRQELSIAEKDALIAALDVDLYTSSVGELSRYLRQLGFTPGGAAAAAGGLLKLFGVGNRKDGKK